MKLLTIAIICLNTHIAFSAEIIKVRKSHVIFKFADSEDIKLGDRLTVQGRSKTTSIVKVIKIKRNKAKAIVLEGKIALWDKLIKENLLSHDPWSAKLILFSALVWRGLDVSGGAPVIMGYLNYNISTNLNSAIKIYNRAINSNSRADLVLKYSPASTKKWGVGFTWYTIPKESEKNSLNFDAWTYLGPLKFTAEHMPEFVGADTTFTYFKVNWSPALSAKANFLSGIGYSLFSNEKGIGFKNYIDYKIGIIYHHQLATMVMAYSNTQRKDISNQNLNDEVFSIKLVKSL